MSQGQMKFCVHCSRPAELLCSRCSDSYCSTECQKSDWQFHRTICFKMPTLVPNLDALEEKLSTTLVLKTNRSNDGSPPKIPARRSSEEKISKPIEVTPMKKQEVDVKKAEDICEPNKMQNDRKLMTPRLKIDPEVNVSQPTKPLKVPSVPAVARGPMKFNTSEEMKKPEETKKPEEAKKPDLEEVKKPEPKIEKTTTPEVKKPAAPEVKKPAAPEVMKPKPMMMKDMKEVAWSDGKNIKAKIMTILQNNVITMCEASEKVECYYNYIGQEIAKYCVGKARDGYLPVRGELVFGLFEGEWYRAQVLDPHTKGTIVQYIDYGNCCTLMPDEMLPVPQDMKFDLYARDYIVENIPAELNDKQEEILTSGIVTITNVRKSSEDNLYHCTIFGF